MTTIKQGGGKQPTPKQGSIHHCKVTTFPPHLQEVYQILSDGNEYSAKQINDLTGRNDARKAISELIGLGVQIVKRSAQGSRRKEYRLLTKNKAYTQAQLFPNEAEKGGER